MLYHIINTCASTICKIINGVQFVLVKSIICTLDQAIKDWVRLGWVLRSNFTNQKRGKKKKRKRKKRERMETTYLVAHSKQATQCPQGRKKQSLGASKQIAQRRRVLLLFSPSPWDFPSREANARKSSISSSSCETES